MEIRQNRIYIHLAANWGALPLIRPAKLPRDGSAVARPDWVNPAARVAFVPRPSAGLAVSRRVRSPSVLHFVSFNFLPWTVMTISYWISCLWSGNTPRPLVEGSAVLKKEILRPAGASTADDVVPHLSGI